MKRSPAKRASREIRNARRRSRTNAPENSAIAPTGVKFQGCGSMRTAAASRITTRMTIVRRTKPSFISFSDFIFALPPLATNRKTQRNHVRRRRRCEKRQAGEKSARQRQKYEIHSFRRTGRCLREDRGRKNHRD